MQGLGAEIAFLIFAYKVWTWPVAMLSGALAGLAAGLNDWIFYYQGRVIGINLIYVACAVVSGAIIAGLGAWLIVKGLAKTGALSRFASGREAERVSTPGGAGHIRATGWGWRHAGRLAWAVRDLDLTIEPGERVLLLGASGSGKSTLLRGIAGLLASDEGESEGSLVAPGRGARGTRAPGPGLPGHPLPRRRRRGVRLREPRPAAR